MGPTLKLVNPFWKMELSNLAPLYVVICILMLNAFFKRCQTDELINYDADIYKEAR